MDVAIIGGGAAGFFLAANLKRMAPQCRITIFEKHHRVLAKVAVSGGGRCNLTNSFAEVKDLKNVYPRGDKLLKRLFKSFGHEEAYRWFEEHDVPLVTQDDQCVFPRSQDAQSIIRCLLHQTQAAGVSVQTGRTLERIVPTADGSGCYRLVFRETGEERAPLFDCVAVTTGGCPKAEGLHYLEALGHRIAPPVPSLFTFNVPDPALRSLMGTVVNPAIASIPGTKFRATGPLLITHWGLSGPAILKLSSQAARHTNECGYRFPLLVNWVDTPDSEAVAETLAQTASAGAQKRLAGTRPYDLPARLWVHLLTKVGLTGERRWGEMGRKNLNRLADVLCNDRYEVDGRGTFREEFVTCGGISLESVDSRTLESKVCPGLYFAGEVLDIDGVTGGFNFQAAWTTAWTVAQAITGKATEE